MNLDAIEKGYYCVYVDEVQVSRHTKPLKAVSRAQEEKIKNGDAYVYVKQPNIEPIVEVNNEAIVYELLAEIERLETQYDMIWAEFERYKTLHGGTVDEPVVTPAVVDPPSEFTIYGFGSDTVGGTGGTIIEVTNLNDSGAGSLRAAVETSGARIVQTKVSGNIELLSPLTIANDNITIDGSDGQIALINNTTNINASEVIIHNLRFRLGDNGYSVDGTNSPDYDTILVAGEISNIVLNKCSISWGIDENLSTYTGTGFLQNVTFQYCLVAHGLNASHHGDGSHSMGTLLNGLSGGFTRNVTIYKCLYSGHGERMFRANGGTHFQAVNNLIDGYYDACTFGYGVYADIVNNVYQSGGMTPLYSQLVGLTSGGANGYVLADTTLYIDGNINDAGQNEWSGAKALESTWVLDSGIQNHLDTTADAIIDVLANVGATPRDSYDTQLIVNYNNQTTTLIDSQVEVGGFPDLTGL
jgi:hypothetical protein